MSDRKVIGPCSMCFTPDVCLTSGCVVESELGFDKGTKVPLPEDLVASTFVPMSAQERVEFDSGEDEPDELGPLPDGVTLRFFRPRKDILAYELAHIIGHIYPERWRRISTDGILFTNAVWNALPEGVKRHWSET